MDAVVFFAAAVMISSVLMFYSSGPGAIDGDANQVCPDTAVMLDVVLRASIGHEVEVALGVGMTIPSTFTVYECLAAEMHALEGGVSNEVFQELNEAILAIIRSACGHSFVPHLLVLGPDLRMDSPMIAIPTVPPASFEAYASSCEMPRADGSQTLVALVLCPALLPELA